MILPTLFDAYQRRVESIKNTDAARAERGIKWVYLSPLMIAPVLPLIRIGFRHNHEISDRLFKIEHVRSFVHVAALISGLYS
jgi:hypothetical protein